MIIVQLLGGLGNQLYQYCLGQRLAADYQVPMCVDTRLLETIGAQIAVQRRFALDIFQADIPMARFSDVVRYSSWGPPRIIRGFLKASKISQESRQWRELKFGYDPGVLGCGPQAYLSGFWQSYRYFETIQDVLKQQLRFRYDLPQVSAEIADRIAAADSVCLHVRRTDYVSATASSNPLGFVGLDYYRTAVQEMLSRYPSSHFFVFSDDLEWCRANLNFVPNAEFVGNEHSGIKDSGHLQLMSTCQRFIIPNSTYSWWAAWLSNRSQKEVFMPDVWFRDSTIDASGFYLPGWHSISTGPKVG